MKTLKLRLLVAVLLLSFVFIGCKKDATVSKNNFTYDLKTYETPKGFLDFSGPQSDNLSSNFDLGLLSSGLTLNLSDTTIIGAGDYSYISFLSPSLTELSSGTYVFDSEPNFGSGSNPVPSSFMDAGIGLTINYSNETGNEYYVGSASTGTATVSKSGTTYEITYTFTLEGGKTVAGYYKGTLQYIDDSGSKKKKSKQNSQHIMKFKK